MADATLEEFWAITDSIGWGGETTDYKAVLTNLQMKHSDEYIKQLHSIADKLSGDVYVAAEATERSIGSNNFFDASDDGWSDATLHIVGMGEKAYTTFIADPDKWIAAHGTNFYTENFGYCFLII